MILAVVVVLVVFVGALILSGDFRHWLVDNLTAIGLLIADAIPVVGAWLVSAFNWVRRVVGIYAFILLCVAVVALVLMIIGLFIHWPTGSAFLFVLAICLVILAWLPAGIILRVFRVTDAIVPCALRALIAWIAFLGWLCLMCPDVITMKTLLGAALFGFVFFGSTVKTKAIDKLLIPIVVCMTLWAAYGFFFPESYRSSTRFIESIAKWTQTAKDRSSIKHEMNAATTYGTLLQDVSILYDLEGNNLTEHEIATLKMGTMVKIANRRNEVKEIDGQGFIQIILAKANKSFTGGKKYWVEAEFVQLVTPRELIPENDALIKNHQQAKKEVTSVRDSIFTQGTYYIDVNGVTPFNIVVHPTKTGCARYNMSSSNYNYKISYFGGGVIHDGPNVVYPYYATPKFQLISPTSEQVKLVVS